MIWMAKCEVDVSYSNNIGHIKDGIVDLAAGTVGGIINVAAGQPLDTVKVKMQTFPTFYPKAIACFESVLRLDGIRGLYAGAIPALTANIAENAILFAAYGYCRKMVAFCIGRSKLEDMTPFENALSGSLASVFAAVAICPTELVKCKLQAQREAFPGLRSTPFSVCRDMYRTDGLKAFYTGILRTALSGGIGGVVLWSAVYPVDVIKSRMQVAGSGRFINIFRNIVRNEGIRTLYNGLTITLIRAFCATGCLFVSYENSKLLFKTWLS